MDRRSFLLSSAAAALSVPPRGRRSASAGGGGAYVPAPRPVRTKPFLVGALTCPLWREGTRGKVWQPLAAYPERTPLLGYYDEGSPEVTDWEVKWAIEHGIGLFVPCWYRARDNLGKPVQTVLGHWLHDGLFHSRYGHMVRFALLWENVNPIACGVESERDLLDNVLPYWIEHYFRRPNYLRDGDRPVVFLYGPQALASQLGGTDRMRAVLARVRRECERAGLGGLVVYGENHDDRPAEGETPARQMAQGGLDAVFSYHWPTFSRHRPPGVSPGPQALVEAQERCWADQASGPLPAALTVSMGWDSRPWGSAYSDVRWQLAPPDFEALCRRARAFAAGRRGGGLAGRLVLVDNWNEFGEGHYVMPTRQYRFGHLDALRSVFAPRAGSHRDLVPEDLGLGPYDSLYRAGLAVTAETGTSRDRRPAGRSGAVPASRPTTRPRPDPST